MTTTLKDVQDTLRQLISDCTIIVGHSADTDLKVCADYDTTCLIIYIYHRMHLYLKIILVLLRHLSYQFKTTFFLFYSGAAAGTQSSDWHFCVVSPPDGSAVQTLTQETGQGLSAQGHPGRKRYLIIFSWCFILHFFFFLLLLSFLLSLRLAACYNLCFILFCFFFDDAEGHDSVQDAAIALELAFLKAREGESGSCICPWLDDPVPKCSILEPLLSCEVSLWIDYSMLDSLTIS